MRDRFDRFLKLLQRFVDRIWFPPAIGLLAALDNFILFIPTDGVLLSSSIVAPRRWIWLALSVALGSTIGAAILAGLVQAEGLPWILDVFPGINTTSTWEWSARFFEQYGLILVFAVAASPLVQQPAVILASLAGTSLFTLVSVLFCGRLAKYLVMSYIGSHAPRLLKRPL